MKYNFIFLLIFLFSCVPNQYQSINKSTYSSKGFAYIFNQEDYEKKIIKKKLDNDNFQIAHNKFKPGTLIKIINLKTKDEIVLKISKRIEYPDFYKVVITEPVAKKIKLDFKLPLVEIIEVKKNKSFIAEKTKIFKEEEKIHSNAPVETVTINNISKSNPTIAGEKKVKFIITIAEFYSKESAFLLKKRITKKLTNFNNKKLFIKKKNDKISLLSGPYTTINLMKNDYIQLKNFGFEELDININE